MKLNELAKQIHQDAVDKGFWDDKREIGTLLMLIVSELSEALEADRKRYYCNLVEYEKYRKQEYRNKFRQETDVNFMPKSTSMIKSNGEIEVESFEICVKDTFEDEIADSIIRLLDLCGGKGIDIEKHIELKMKYNKGRGRKHGKSY